MSKLIRPKKYDKGLTAALIAAGGPTALAKKLNVVPSAITQWRRVPAERAMAVAEATEVPLHVLRPDLWAAPATAA